MEMRKREEKKRGKNRIREKKEEREWIYTTEVEGARRVEDEIRNHANERDCVRWRKGQEMKIGYKMANKKNIDSAARGTSLEMERRRFSLSLFLSLFRAATF